MTWHLIEGPEGCAFARENACVAVIVDALRASATAAMLLHHGATEIHAVREVEHALKAKDQLPQALLYGERGGLPPQGFDHGNSPRDTAPAAGRPVIFTTTTGTARLAEAFGARALYMGTTVNADAVAMAAAAHEKDVVLIPAGLTGDHGDEAQEDWAAAVSIALCAGAPIGEGAPTYRGWRQRIEFDGVPALFDTAPHAEDLRAIGLAADIPYCAKLNLTQAVPQAIAQTAHAILLKNASP